MTWQGMTLSSAPSDVVARVSKSGMANAQMVISRDERARQEGTKSISISINKV